MLSSSAVTVCWVGLLFGGLAQAEAASSGDAEPASECPVGTLLQRTKPPTALQAWCELTLPDGTSVRHGPFASFFEDGQIRRSGVFDHGRQHGCWRTFDQAGRLKGAWHSWFGATGRPIEDVYGHCSEGTRLIRVGAVDGRLEDSCMAVEGAQRALREGPEITYDQVATKEWYSNRARDCSPDEFRPDAASIWRIRDFSGGSFHGEWLQWHRPDVLEIEANYRDGLLHGPWTRWDVEGRKAEQRHYEKGQLNGLRTGFDAEGGIRWQAQYRQGRLLEKQGDPSVAGQPCPEDAVPMNSADGREEWCERLLYGSHPQKHGAYVSWATDGTVIERGLYEEGRKAEVWDQPPGASSDGGRLVAIGRLTFDGRLLHEISLAEPSFWFRDEASGVEVKPETEYRDGLFKVYGLPPGEYFLSVNVDANDENPSSYPGDFRTQVGFHVKDELVSKIDVALRGLIHIVAPEDNGTLMASWTAECNAKPTFPGPVRFAWKPLGDGVVYKYRVAHMVCEPFRRLGMVAEGSTRDSEIVLALPATPDGEIYRFEVSAFRGGRMIAGFMTHGEYGHGWDYRFGVRVATGQASE